MVALAPFRRYATALRTSLPHATRALDASHVTRLRFRRHLDDDDVDPERRRPGSWCRWGQLITHVWSGSQPDLPWCIPGLCVPSKPIVWAQFLTCCP